MRTLLTALAAATILTAASAAPALAGPPFQTDDPDPTPYRFYEIYLNTQLVHDAGSVTGTLPALEVNYGALPNVQVSLTTQLSTNYAASPMPWIGYGDTELAVKLRFIQETKSRPQIAFYPAVVMPTGNAAAQLGGGYVKSFFPLWAQKDVGRWTVFGGGGVWHNPGPGNRDYTFSGLAAERSVGEKWTYGGEIFHSSPDTIGGRTSTGFSVGSIHNIDPRHQVLFSVGRSLGAQNVLNVYAAYELYLGPKNAAGQEPN